MAGEKVGEAYMDLVIDENSVTKSLKETESRITNILKNWHHRVQLKADDSDVSLSSELKLKTLINEKAAAFKAATSAANAEAQARMNASDRIMAKQREEYAAAKKQATDTAAAQRAELEAQKALTKERLDSNWRIMDQNRQTYAAARQQATQTATLQRAETEKQKTLDRERLNIVMGINDALDEQIAKSVAITNTQKAASGGFFNRLMSGGGLQGNQRQIMNQFTYSMQDFLTVLTMPGMGIGGALRGAANNWSMILMQLSPVAALMSSMAVSALPALFDWMGKTTSQTEKQAEANNRLAESFRYLDQQMSHRSQMRQASDVTGVKTATQADDDLMRTAQDKTELLARQKDEQEKERRLNEEKRKRIVSTVGKDAMASLVEVVGAEEMGGVVTQTKRGLTPADVEMESRIANARRRGNEPMQMGPLTRQLAESQGLNPDEHDVMVRGNEVLFIRRGATEEIKKIEEELNQVMMQHVKTADELAEKEKKIAALREKRVELTKQEAEQQDLSKRMQIGPSRFLGEVNVPQLDQESADKVAKEWTELQQKEKQIQQMRDSGAITDDMADEMRTNARNEFKNNTEKEVARDRKQREAEQDKVFNEGEAANKRWQAKQEQMKRFQFGLELGAVDDRRVFENRRKTAEFQLQEDLRRNEELTRDGSEERSRGVDLANNKYKADMKTITMDEERAKSRVRIDALRHADPRKWAIEEAEFRRKERLRQLDLTGATGAERAGMEAMINKASAMERVELLKQADKKNPAEFIGGQEMWKKIQLGLLQQPDSPAVKAAQKTAENTGKLVEMFGKGTPQTTGASYT